MLVNRLLARAPRSRKAESRVVGGITVGLVPGQRHRALGVHSKSVYLLRASGGTGRTLPVVSRVRRLITAPGLRTATRQIRRVT